jgi:hypothetical protein
MRGNPGFTRWSGVIHKVRFLTSGPLFFVSLREPIKLLPMKKLFLMMAFVVLTMVSTTAVAGNGPDAPWATNKVEINTADFEVPVPMAIPTTWNILYEVWINTEVGPPYMCTPVIEGTYWDPNTETAVPFTYEDFDDNAGHTYMRVVMYDIPSECELCITIEEANTGGKTQIDTGWCPLDNSTQWSFQICTDTYSGYNSVWWEAPY